jgi:acyl-coenzyme A synthetase/AMP-(fatty) acid ligase
MLGVVPSLVKAWQLHGMTAGCDWSAIRRFSSTGETSSADAMLWLASRAGYKPIIEYCGGTEIGAQTMRGRCRVGFLNVSFLNVSFCCKNKNHSWRVPRA